MKTTPSLMKPYDPPPTLRLDEDDLAAIKDWSVGETYTITVKAKMVAMRHGEEYMDEETKGKPKVSATFRIEGIDEPPSSPPTRDAKLAAIRDKAK